MDQADFWQFLERSGEATATPDDRLAWLSRRLHKIALDHVADLPAVQALAARPFADWSDDDWPWFEFLAYAARTVYTERTGIEDGIEEALNERGIFPRADPSPPDPSRPFDGARHLPRLAALFPR